MADSELDKMQFSPGEVANVTRWIAEARQLMADRDAWQQQCADLDGANERLHAFAADLAKCCEELMSTGIGGEVGYIEWDRAVEAAEAVLTTYRNAMGAAGTTTTED